jgi:F-type H+-transporting ATPase subunit alpha
VLVIWAASNGFTDDIAVEEVKGFETELLKFIENSHPGLLQDIREKKSLTDEIKSDLQVVLKDFKDLWKEKTATTDASMSAAESTSAADPVTVSA